MKPKVTLHGRMRTLRIIYLMILPVCTLNVLVMAETTEKFQQTCREGTSSYNRMATGRKPESCSMPVNYEGILTGVLEFSGDDVGSFDKIAHSHSYLLKENMEDAGVLVTFLNGLHSTSSKNTGCLFVFCCNSQFFN